jgi:hypothetical protein
VPVFVVIPSARAHNIAAWKAAFAGMSLNDGVPAGAGVEPCTR